MSCTKLSPVSSTKWIGILNGFLCLWMTFFYLGVVFLYPTACATHGILGHEPLVQNASLTDETSLLPQATTLTEPSTTVFIASPPSFNSLWRLASILKTLCILDCSIATDSWVSWIEYSPKTLFNIFPSRQIHHQFKTPPLDQPPQRSIEYPCELYNMSV